jgi:hypothetical protein
MVGRMRRWFWFLLVFLFVGLFLFVLGLYCVYMVGESWLGFGFLIAGAVLWGVLLVVGMIYVAQVRIKILRDASEF